MNRRVNVIVVGGAAILLATVAAVQQPRGERTILQSRGAHILSQIKATDRSVRVISSQAMPMVVLPPPETSLVDWLTSAAKGVWLIQVSRDSGRISAEGDFVDSDVSGKVLEAFKEPTGVSFPVGTELTFSVSGGTVASNGVQIQGVVPWIRHPQVGRTYLLFADLNPDTNELVVPAAGLYEESANGFTTTLTQASAALISLNGSVPETIRSVRAAAQRPQ